MTHSAARCLRNISASGVAEQAGSEIRLSLEPATLAAVFGVDSADVACRFLGQLINVVRPDPGKPIDAATINPVIDVVKGISPSNVLEAMTATMLVAAHHAALDAARRALHPDQTPRGRESYMNLTLKAMRTFAQLAESLNRGRGQSTTPRAVVEHLPVRNGGEPVVAAIGPRN